ncbi:MAG: peptidoglycan editing factor PgeF [Acidobacteria bacterium]|nr:peptidoglycan editing factor PgeF [Acidobacteriota bacterium]
MTLPPVPESFSWTESPAGLVLTCRPLDAVTPHLFTTRQLQLTADDWRRVAGLLGARQAVTLNQVHGRDVVVVRAGAPPPVGQPTGDVLVSDDPAAAIAVRAADCAPLLLADTRSGAAAAVHAGWRGTAAGAAAAAVDALRQHFGAAPGNLIVAIGPSIGACCYEVGSDVVDAFAAAGHPRHLVDRWFVVRNARLYLDVAGANRDQLVLAGVPDAQIHDCRLCTAMHLDVLTSYRAERERAGRMAGAIRARA